jgi:hypothetical protein
MLYYRGLAEYKTGKPLDVSALQRRRKSESQVTGAVLLGQIALAKNDLDRQWLL